MYDADPDDDRPVRQLPRQRLPECAGPWDEDCAAGDSAEEEVSDLDPCSDCGAGAGEACREGCIVPHLEACKPCRDLRPCAVGMALMEAA